jgi:SAM-dependent methyltransferase
VQPTWVSDDELHVDGERFQFAMGGLSTDEAFIVAKVPNLARLYLQVLEQHQSGNIVELGIFQGGSAALAWLIGQPQKLVALDIGDPVAALERFIADRELGERLRTHYHIDQGDRSAVRDIIDDEFGDAHLDLVIDDASHLGPQTRVSFDELFPRLRPGGLYLIEDWNWEIAAGEWLEQSFGGADVDLLRQALLPRLHPDDEWWPMTCRWFTRALADPVRGGSVRDTLTGLGVDLQIFGAEPATAESASARDRAGAGSFLATLVFELTLAAAEHSDVVAEVSIGPWWVTVRRGPAALRPAEFSLRALIDDHFELLAP